MPVTFAQLGAKAEDIPELAHKVLVHGDEVNDTLWGFTQMSKDDIVKIYELML